MNSQYEHLHAKNDASVPARAASSLSRRTVIKTLSGIAAFGSSLPLLAQDTKPKSSTPLLDQLDKLPESERMPWMLRMMYDEPLPLFKELRTNRPILRIGNVVFIARYTDVIESLRHPTVFSVRLYKDKMGDFLMTHDETPIHRRDKAVMTAMLPQSDEARIRSLIGEFCNTAIAQSNGKIDIVDKLTRAAPIHLVQTYFGLDGIESAKLREWSYWSQYDNFHNHEFQARANAEEVRQNAIRSKQELAIYVTSLIKRRATELTQDPARDDVVSRLLKSRLPESLGFDLQRIVINTMGLLIGAVETTSQATVQAIDVLLDRPQQLAEAAASADFDGLSKYTWEASRFRPLAPYVFRYCEEDFTLAKDTDRRTKVPKGTIVLPLVHSAMFDENEFERPETFLAERPSYQSFLFSFGNHRCLGEHIGRQMIPSIIGSLLRRKNIRRGAGAAGKIDYKGGPFPESLTLQFDG